MRRSSLVLLSSVILAALLAGCSSGGTSIDENSYVAGDGVVTVIKSQDRKLAPTIDDKGINGEIVSTSAGNVTLINVWASWCSPCRAEAPILEELSKKYPKVNFIGLLTRDSVESARAFTKRFEITYPTIANDQILLDFRKSLPVAAIPTTFLVDKNGKVATRISGEITYSAISKLIEDLERE